jgi:hypothetical protein
MYAVEVVADSSGAWCGNGIKFETVKAAEAYALDLFSRWTAVQKWRVINSATKAVVRVSS